jgi:4-hydroxy-tetrahydrodipicolinate reductase
MKIALIGYGKMGQAIERVAQQRGHTVVLKIRRSNIEDFSAENLRHADVAIEFTSPESAHENCARALNAGIPTVCGSTGWNAKVPETAALATSRKTAFLQTSNFSIGVNIFFEVNRKLAALMAKQPDYKVMIEEVHHTQKKDAPSGTAISLADQVLDYKPNMIGWELNHGQAVNGKLPIKALREEGVPGTHTVSWSSKIDTIDIVHTAHSRDGFALGAVMAAEFVIGKRGVFTMQDVLGL